MTDPITDPAHYSHTRIEPADAIMLLGLDWPSGCVLKYLVRWQRKGGIEDLKKARQMITMMIERGDRWYVNRTADANNASQ